MCLDGGPASNLDWAGLGVYGVRVDSEESRSKSLLITLLFFGTNEVYRLSVRPFWLEGQDEF